MMGGIAPGGGRTAPRLGAEPGALAALAAWCAGLAFVFTLDDPRLRFLPALAGQGLATAAWLLLAARLSRTDAPRALVRLVVAAALVARVAAILLPPVMSEDVFRYVYEGRVVWWGGAAFPFEHPPRDAIALGVPPALIDAAWLRINHPHIPTIYPPFAQLVFALAGGLGELAGGGHLVLLKLLLVAAELGAIGAVAAALRALGRPPGGAALLLLCPVAVLELGRDGHADSLSMLGLALGALGFASLAPRLGFAGFALAALGKLNGLVAIAAALRSTRRGLSGAALLGVLAVPLLLAGPSATTALSTYASEWRAGDGVFSLVLVAAEGVLGGDWRRIGDLTVTRHQLARAVTGVLFLAGAALILRRRAREPEVPEAAGLVLLLLLLLSPTLHPWYTLWLLPLAALVRPGRGRGAMLALIALAPLLHHPGWLELRDGRWEDLALVRAAVHVPVWLWLARDLGRG